VGKLFIPCDFDVPLLFLATMGATIDVKNGKLSLQVGDEKVEFNFP